MSITSNVKYDDLRDLNLYAGHDNVEATCFNYASLFIFWYSLFFYGIFNFLNRNKRVLLTFGRFLEFIRSVVAGLFITLFFMNDRPNLFVQTPFSIYKIFEPNNYPILVIVLVYFFVALSSFFRRRIRLNVDSYFDFKRDIDTFSLNKVPSNKKLRLISYGFSQVKNWISYGIKDFNQNEAPFIYIFYVFIHAFFVGLGFSGCHYISWAEIQILVHKIFEIVRLKQSFKTLRINKNKSFLAILLFFLNTSIGICFRGYIALHDVQYNNMPATKICDNIFAQSVLLMICIELLVPFPISKLDLVLNWLTTFLSYTFFDSYLNSF